MGGAFPGREATLPFGLADAESKNEFFIGFLILSLTYHFDFNRLPVNLGYLNTIFEARQADAIF